jgi:hypothetical protein
MDTMDTMDTMGTMDGIGPTKDRATGAGTVGVKATTAGGNWEVSQAERFTHEMRRRVG